MFSHCFDLLTKAVQLKEIRMELVKVLQFYYTTTIFLLFVSQTKDTEVKIYCT